MGDSGRKRAPAVGRRNIAWKMEVCVTHEHLRLFFVGQAVRLVLCSVGGVGCCAKRARMVHQRIQGLLLTSRVGHTQAFYLQQQASAVLGATADQLPGLKLHYYSNLTQKSSDSEETKRCGPMPCSFTHANKQPRLHTRVLYLSRQPGPHPHGFRLT